MASSPWLSELVTAEPTICLLHLHVSFLLRRREVWSSTSKPQLLEGPV